jgi:hypothetical protein
MKAQIEAFLADVDRALAPAAEGQVLEVYHIGRSALVWEYGYTASTNDFDFLHPKKGEELLDLALQLFGPGKPKAVEHGLYLEVVYDAFPPMPQAYKKRARRVEGPWDVLRVYHLDPYDMIASKLRRFSAKDRSDIRMLCDQCPIDPVRLEEILETAYPFNLEKDGDEFRDSAFRSLRVVQRYLRHEIDEF